MLAAERYNKTVKAQQVNSQMQTNKHFKALPSLECTEATKSPYERTDIIVRLCTEFANHESRDKTVFQNYLTLCEKHFKNTLEYDSGKDKLMQLCKIITALSSLDHAISVIDFDGRIFFLAPNLKYDIRDLTLHQQAKIREIASPSDMQSLFALWQMRGRIVDVFAIETDELLKKHAFGFTQVDAAGMEHHLTRCDVRKSIKIAVQEQISTFAGYKSDSKNNISLDKRYGSVTISSNPVILGAFTQKLAEQRQQDIFKSTKNI